jgi:hypothetical protein
MQAGWRVSTKISLRREPATNASTSSSTLPTPKLTRKAAAVAAEASSRSAIPNRSFGLSLPLSTSVETLDRAIRMNTTGAFTEGSVRIQGEKNGNEFLIPDSDRQDRVCARAFFGFFACS